MRQGINQSTIRVFEPNGLAPEEKERLLGALESLANVGDGPEEFRKFGRMYPELFRDKQAEEFHAPNDTGPAAQYARGAISHGLALIYRNELRKVWDRSPAHEERKLGSNVVANLTFLGLLGLGEFGSREVWIESCKRSLASVPDADKFECMYHFCAARFAGLWADWKTGAFEYQPRNDFQRAVYILFREGWRAKACPRCSRRFIAGKPVQVYCSTQCFEEVKRERGNQWWRAHGKRWRVNRAGKAALAKTRKKPDQDKRTLKGAK